MQKNKQKFTTESTEIAETFQNREKKLQKQSEIFGSGLAF